MGNIYFGDAAPHMDETLDHHMAFTRLRQHWNSLRETSREPPKAHDLQPHILGAALPFVFLVENLGGDILRLKLGGTHLCDVMGMELRGMPLRCFLPIMNARALLPRSSLVSRGLRN
ncbi:PAS domain-containing protein [Rhodobacterales bacterium LSUCC0246]|nr:PAS domain-containing protein [Rhodobacterales bacterium LSUCC0374]